MINGLVVREGEAENFGFQARWPANTVRSPFFFRTSRDLPSSFRFFHPHFFSTFPLFPSFVCLSYREVTAMARSQSIKGPLSGLFQVLPPWKAAKSGSMSFKIRTNEPNGLIMYSRSGAHTRVRFFLFI